MFTSRQKQQIEAQRDLLARAADRIEQLEGQIRETEIKSEALRGKADFILSQLEGAWEAPVIQANCPRGTSAVVVTESDPDLRAMGLEPLTVLALESAFPGRARLEELEESGWALVRAWPLNAPDTIERLPGYKTDSYMLCALTSLALRRDMPSGHHLTEPAAPGFETRV